MIEPGPTDGSLVLAEPTKGFFVSMLVRDIELLPAVVDLVDNSIDGARKLRGGGSFEGLWVRLEVGDGHFRIHDNCGGIPIDVARHYAFRFGRPSDAPNVARSVGQFGVGMKRALFKLGSAFSVHSTEATSDFVLTVDVPTWTAEPGWNLEFDAYHDHVTHAPDSTGTDIRVEPLHDEVATDLSIESFASQLAGEVEHKHNEAISRGLTISINSVPVHADPLVLLRSDAIRPAAKVMSFDATDLAPVQVRLFAGVGPSAPQEAGWRIYCNGRLILGPDRTQATVWGEGRGRTIPSFHTQFSRFRGYAFFESDDASRLPWTTTKVGVDGNSAIWRATRRELVVLTRPVIDFLNAIDWERPNLPSEDVEHLEHLVEQATNTRLDLLPSSDVFRAPGRKRLEAPPATSSIQYRRLVSEIDVAKRLLGVTSNSDVGQRTFDYFIDAEGEGG